MPTRPGSTAPADAVPAGYRGGPRDAVPVGGYELVDAAPGAEERQLRRVPWSLVGPEFIAVWGYRDGVFDPEFVEILGPMGSGKSYFEATILQQRALARNSAVILIVTKAADKTFSLLGWPVVDSWRGVSENRQCIFWPQTRLLGRERKAYMNAKVYDLLSRLWGQHTPVIVAFDEIATVEALSADMAAMIAMYWREARSVGITLVAMKQRPQGVQRDMHSEASWVTAFKPKDEDDGARVAQIMGGRRVWLPILQQLDRDKREFVLLHAVTGEAVISWIDVPLRPAVPERRGIYPTKQGA